MREPDLLHVALPGAPRIDCAAVQVCPPVHTLPQVWGAPAGPELLNMYTGCIGRSRRAGVPSSVYGVEGSYPHRCDIEGS